MSSSPATPARCAASSTAIPACAPASPAPSTSPTTTAPELAAIYRGLVDRAGFQLVPEAEDALLEACDTLLRARAETFGNGRAMRTLWERTREAQAGRVMQRDDRTAGDLMTVEAADIDAAIAVGATA